jgi:Zeta toxin
MQQLADHVQVSNPSCRTALRAVRWHCYTENVLRRFLTCGAMLAAWQPPPALPYVPRRRPEWWSSSRRDAESASTDGTSDYLLNLSERAPQALERSPGFTGLYDRARLHRVRELNSVVPDLDPRALAPEVDPRVFAPDVARSVVPAYRRDHGWAGKFQDGAVALATAAFTAHLRKAGQHGDGRVVLLGGGCGAGKSTYLSGLLQADDIVAVWDGTCSWYTHTKELLVAIRSAHLSPEVHYVYQYPETTMQGVVKRAINSGRAVPVKVVAGSLIRSADTICRIAGEEQLPLTFVDNSRVPSGHAPPVCAGPLAYTELCSVRSGMGNAENLVQRLTAVARDACGRVLDCPDRVYAALGVAGPQTVSADVTGAMPALAASCSPPARSPAGSPVASLSPLR